MNALNRCALVVDDEAIIAELWCAYLDMMGLRVCGVAATGLDAIALAEQYRPAVVLMDMRLRGNMDGVETALVINGAVGSKMIFITASTEPQTLARIALDHPAAVLIKPVPEHLLKTTIDAVLTEPGAS